MSDTARAVETAKALARRFEGLRLNSYICPAGVVTVGYGATGAGVVYGMTITREWAEERLHADMLKFVTGALQACPVLRSHPMALAACGDFAFNVGLAALRGSTLRRRLLAEDWDSARHELRRWVRGGGRVLPGLVLRREAEAAIL